MTRGSNESADTILLAILQFEQFLNRFAKTGRRRNIDHPCGVANARGREKADRAPGRTGHAGQDAISLSQTAFGWIGDLFLAFDPAVAGDQHVAVFGNDKVFGRNLDFSLPTASMIVRRLASCSLQ